MVKVNIEVNNPYAHSLGKIGSGYERPKSPWTPSYSATSQGPAVLESLHTEDEIEPTVSEQLPSSLLTNEPTNDLNLAHHSTGTQSSTAKPLGETEDPREIVTATALPTEVAAIHECSGDITTIRPPTEIPTTNVSFPSMIVALL
jgi:hypothetical protein